MMAGSMPAKGESHQEPTFNTAEPDPDSTPLTTALPVAPDGGLQAWLQVLAAHLVLMNTFVSLISARAPHQLADQLYHLQGYMNSFGIFQAYYTSVLGRTASDISWVGSFEFFMVYFLGTFSGRAMDAGYLRQTVALGLFLVVLGVFMTSLSTQYWQLFLAQGICQGIGCGLLFCPIIALISTYFARKRALAISLQASGAATGGIIFPAIAQSLLDRIGFGWTVRVMGFVMLFNSVIVMLLLRPRTDLPRKPLRDSRLVDLAAFKDPTYTLFTIGTFLTFWGVYFAYFYIRPYARDILGVSSWTSFSLLLVMNGIGIPGRIIPAIIADRYSGALVIFIPTVFASGVLLYAWNRVVNEPGIWAFAAVYGYFGAGVQSLFPASLANLTPPGEIGNVGVRVGMVFSIISFAALSGPPIAGALIVKDGGSYLGAQMFGGTVMVLGAGFLVAAKVTSDRKLLRHKT